MIKQLTIVALLVAASSSVTAQERYALDRVYTGNQVSNTVSVVDPSTNLLLGEILLGKAQPNVLTALYKGQALVHGLGYSPAKRLLAVVAIGSNSVVLVDTETNKPLKTIYTGRAPHEATFKPDGSEVWVTVRGEAYLSVINSESMEEVKQVKVSDGPGMVAFTPDGRWAYCCSSFSPYLDIIDTESYEVVKRIEVPSPFSPNIFTSPDGSLVALSLKDIGKVVVVDTKSQEITKVFATGPITNHVSFLTLNGRLLMPVTVGGENCVKIYDVMDDYKEIANIPVGQLPHGLWGSPDGKRIYVGLEYADQVQPIDLETMQALPPLQIGQSPQALLYAPNAVTSGGKASGLKPLVDAAPTQTLVLKPTEAKATLKGQLSVRSIGLTDLVEQLFLQLKPATAYDLVLTRSKKAPYKEDYLLNSFVTDDKGKYAGQSTGIIKSRLAAGAEFKHVVLIEQATGKAVLVK